jgi:hypothetical protein
LPCHRHRLKSSPLALVSYSLLSSSSRHVSAPRAKTELNHSFAPGRSTKHLLSLAQSCSLGFRPFTMRATLAVLALAGSAAAQAVTSLIVPSSTPPAGCDNSRQSSFSLEIVSANGSSAASSSSAPARRALDLGSRQNGDGNLQLSLSGGILTDSNGRTGYIASNYQFQFDKPPQAGAIYTAGWTICPNGSLALGGQAYFWQCKSGSFYNLYDRDFAPAHCYPVYFYSSSGAGQVFSTPPPGPEVTGASEATIKNGGGTQSMNSTAAATSTGIGNTMASGSGTSATSSGGSQIAAATGSGGSAGSSGGSTPSGGASASPSAGGAVADAPQALFAWVVGLAGALAMI